MCSSDLNDELAPFSNFGRTSVDLAAPGVGILSTEPTGSFASRNGTSMAAPHVSGVAALIWSVAPQATVAEVREQILLGVDTREALRSRLSSGGRLNAMGALTVDRIVPRAQLETGSLQDITEEGGTFQTFVVNYTDNTAIDWNEVIFKGLVIKGVYGREMFETWYKMAAMLQSGLDITPIITHRLPIAEFRDGFEIMGSGQSGKVILDWAA